MDNTVLHNFIINYFADHNLPTSELTLVGIRDSRDQEKDIINDQLGFFTDTELFLCKGTTDPSVYWTKDTTERNKQGTFHLLEGFHEKIWSIGTHKGYEALTNQYPQCKPTKGWRDANYNFTRDAKEIEFTGYFGVNYHRMHPISIVDKIGKYSAGCQVLQDVKNLKYVLDKVKSTEMYKADKKVAFNYMLFTIDQIPKS